MFISMKGLALRLRIVTGDTIRQKQDGRHPKTLSYPLGDRFGFPSGVTVAT